MAFNQISLQPCAHELEHLASETTPNPISPYYQSFPPPPFPPTDHTQPNFTLLPVLPTTSLPSHRPHPTQFHPTTSPSHHLPSLPPTTPNPISPYYQSFPPPPFPPTTTPNPISSHHQSFPPTTPNPPTAFHLPQHRTLISLRVEQGLSANVCTTMSGGMRR